MDDLYDEVERRVGWGESGDVACVECGKTVRLWFNGGELDYQECCRYAYTQEYPCVPDLVIGRLKPSPLTGTVTPPS